MHAHAFVTTVIKNDSYVPGALVLAHALRQQETQADLVCLLTPEVDRSAEPAALQSLGELFDRVLTVAPLKAAGGRGPAPQRHYLNQVLTRVHALRLAADGDLGCAYERVVVLDADILPLRCYDHLFLVPAPAGILNERADLFKRCDDGGRYVSAGSLAHGRWQWHHAYRALPHGAPIPARVTDRVRVDPANYGVNTALMVVEPSMEDHEGILAALASPDAAELLGRFRWPDMQFLTAHWSGRWHNVDLCFAGLGGYPDLTLLFGTHFAGPKPWALRNRTVRERFARFPDFRRWYAELASMLDAHPVLRRWSRLARLERFAREVGRFDPTRRDTYVHPGGEQ